ncbi:AI-2E family transporter [Noviherbaspirillum suwonense]|uniref:Predicted PurR-regulated permease PerM n=1 Tax=Noviherbaspirillum suwonense TaxID=1224511 RepID=A0ABY1PV39_9BURK|nr:Predicted PurR-regulated permease PerM [Noviherbaspirillum suwonense]
MNKPVEAAAQAPTATSNPNPDILTVERPGVEPALMLNPRVAVDARGMALCVVAAVAFLYALQWSQKFLIPVVFGILISYTLNPVVRWLERIRIPRVVGTTLVMLVLTLGAAAAGNTLRAQFQSILEGLPEAAQKISTAVARAQQGKKSALQQMQEAASEIEKATSQAAGARQSRGAPAPAADAPKLRISELVNAGLLGAVGFIGQTTMVLFLVFFLLLSGDTFKRKLVKLTGPKLSQKKITVQILDDINTSIQNYMFMLLVTNLMLAAMMWIALRWIGLENAGAWGAAAGFLHLIPYFGPLLITISTGVTAFLQFGNASTAFLVAGISLGVATVVGTFVTTWMTGRIAKMNPAAVFIGLLFWGWLWGIWGLLLGVPIIVVMKVIAEHIEGLQSVAELLGE